MGKRRYELDTRVLTVFFFVAMPFVAFGSFVVVGMARGLLEDSVGAGLVQQALEARLLLERYVADQTVHLNLLALDPQVRGAVATPAKSWSPDEARRLEQAWVSGGDPKLNAFILQSPLSNRLREVVDVGPGFTLLQIVDAQGRLVASSARAGRLLNAETPWFHSVVSEETTVAQAYVGDIRRTGGSLAVMDIAYPIRSPADGTSLGALRAVLDASDLYGILAPARAGSHSESYVFVEAPRPLLVRAGDGLLLAADDAQKVLTERFPGFASIQAAMQERRPYWVIPELRTKAPSGDESLVTPARLVAYTPVEKLAGKEWLVVVERDLNGAIAPIQKVTRYLWIHFIGAFVAVILLALYFSFQLEAPVIDEELHLHEEHLPTGMRATGQ